MQSEFGDLKSAAESLAIKSVSSGEEIDGDETATKKEKGKRARRRVCSDFLEKEQELMEKKEQRKLLKEANEKMRLELEQRKIELEAKKAERDSELQQ